MVLNSRAAADLVEQKTVMSFNVKEYVTGFGNPDWKKTHEEAQKAAVVVTALLKNMATCLRQKVGSGADNTQSLLDLLCVLGQPTLANSERISHGRMGWGWASWVLASTHTSGLDVQQGAGSR
ncbi:outer envelope protein 64, mitochondrial [Tanacetum coccineum]